jgi:hypothetical protein
MKVLTLPKAAAALEYRALRLPATVLETQFARFLAEDSALRLGFERALGTIDQKAGALLGNESLASRGHALRRRSEMLGKAVQLEAKVDARKAAAAANLEAGKKAAASTRQKAKRTASEGVQQTLQAERADKRRAEQRAEAKLRAETERIESEARAKTEAVEAQLDAQERRIEQTTKARIAAPKALLSDAVADKQAADAERAKAERLATLAADEKESRKAAKA